MKNLRSQITTTGPALTHMIAKAMETESLVLQSESSKTRTMKGPSIQKGKTTIAQAKTPRVPRTTSTTEDSKTPMKIGTTSRGKKERTVTGTTQRKTKEPLAEAKTEDIILQDMMTEEMIGTQTTDTTIDTKAATTGAETKGTTNEETTNTATARRLATKQGPKQNEITMTRIDTTSQGRPIAREQTSKTGLYRKSPASSNKFKSLDGSKSSAVTQLTEQVLVKTLDCLLRAIQTPRQATSQVHRVEEEAQVLQTIGSDHLLTAT